ncbi:MAG: hypothetical protein AAF389_10720 [Gemmatimonadota bacterium]
MTEDLSRMSSMGLPRYVLVTLFVAALGVLAMGTAVSLLTGLPIGNLTRDPAALARVNPFTGAISNIGILGWAAGATVCAFTALVLSVRGRFPLMRFFAGAALVTVLLLVDDLFMLHDSPLPEFRLDERVFYLAYALAVGALLLVFPPYARRFRTWLIILAGLLFAGSIVIDVFEDPLSAWTPLFEDGCKFLGIVAWLAYWLDAAMVTVLDPEIVEGG